MRIVLAMDLRPGSAGALRFVRWLIDSGACDANDVLAVHVIEIDHLLAAVRPFGPGTLPEKLVPLMREKLDALDLPVRAEVLEADNAEQALGEVVERHGAQMLVVGRRGSPSSFVRLGRVARRLLRSLPTSVAVVPPELRIAGGSAGVGPGPILVASDLGSTDTGAIALARELANRTRAGLGAVHVVPTAHTPHTVYERAGVQPIPEHELLATRTQQLDAWRREHGLDAAESVVLGGELVESILSVAERLGAPLLVCGSRRMTVGRRLFVSSVSSSLSGLATCPVLTVPETSEPAAE